MVTLLLAAALVAAPQAAAQNADIRTFCSGDASITEKASKAGTGSNALSFSNAKTRVVRLDTGDVLMIRSENGDDQLVVEENGKFRRLVAGKTTIHSLYLSPDKRKVAVVVTVGERGTLTSAPNAALYLFDTETWLGEQVVKLFGFTGVSWSPDSKVLAYGDYSKARFLDVATGKVMETCGVDSAATPDGREKIQKLGWLGEKQFRMSYQSPSGNHDYLVTLP
jgi:WD40 repeat protein